MESILDRPEIRFPLRLEEKIPKIRGLYRAATRRQWDPATDVDWAAFNHAAYSPEHLMAARLRWSKTAWGEYGAISESPALQIRFCQEKLPADLWHFFSLRTQEESRHAEAAFRMAETLGGYFKEPQGEVAKAGASADKDIKTTLYSHGVRRMALDSKYSTEGIIASLVCVSEDVAFDQFKHLQEVTRDPVARQLISLINRDEARHCAFGWDFMEYRVPQMSLAELDAVKLSVEEFVETIELNGYHHPWLKPDSPAARAEVKAMRMTHEAGLGASIEELEIPVLVDSMARIRKRMKSWGVELKMFSHPKLGVV